MANTRTVTWVRGAWAGVLAGIALTVTLATASMATGQQPEETGRPRKVRDVYKSALDNYKAREYEVAAAEFAQVKIRELELTPAERRDFHKFLLENNTALASRREGNTQLHQVEEFLRQGKTQDASSLVRALSANPYLSSADRQTLTNLNENLRMVASTGGKSGESAVNNDEQSLLRAARDCLKRGEFDTAEMWAKEANKMAPIVHAPWANDTPAKVLRDIASARTKQSPTAPSTSIVKTVTSFLRGAKDDKKDGPDSLLAKGSESPPPPTIGTVDMMPPPLPGNNKQLEGPPVRQTMGNEISSPPGSATSNKALARKLIKEGYRALEANDLEAARLKAIQARELRPDLEWWEENPTRLLEDVQRRANGTSRPGSNANGALSANADARSVIKEARNLFQQDQLEEADRLCSQAFTAQPKGWGLFEDSPEKLHAEIQKARGKRDRDEAVRLMSDARKLFAAGNLKEAKAKAASAQKLHGPYSIWEMGDRPQKLLEEIARAEGRNPDARKNDGPGGAANSAFVKAGGMPTRIGQERNPDPRDPMVPPLVSGTAQAAAKGHAIALLQEAREFQKKGMLIEARTKAIEADQLRASFTAEEDSPASLLLSLAAQCERTVDQLLERAADQVQSHPTDPGRFQKAEADINAARLIARTFRLDTLRIEQKSQWLRQIAATAGIQPMAGVQPASNTADVVQAGGSGILPPAQLPVQELNATAVALDNPAARNRVLGLEKLDKARLELKAGNLPMARKLTEEAFNPMYGIQAEAALLMHTVDADEYNQHVNVANRDADIGIDAFHRGDFRQASGIFNRLDMRMVRTDRAKRIGELMNTPQMQSQQSPVQLVDAKQPGQLVTTTKSGTATATDLPGSEDLTANYKALEEIQFQQLRERSMNVRNTALDLFKAGRKDQAVDALKEYLDELGGSNLDAGRLALLKRPVEARLQQYRTMLAQETIARQVDNVSGGPWKEDRYQKNIRKTQEEVAEHIKLYRSLAKEGKYKEALAEARKAKELDPDNLSADAAIQITSTLIAEQNYQKGNHENETFVLNALNPGSGPYVDNANPLHFDAETNKRARERKTGEAGYSSPRRDKVEQDIERKLSLPVSLSFKNTPLHEALQTLQDMTGVTIQPDRSALQEANISLEIPLTLPVENIKLKSALNILLEQVKLTYVIKDQILQITTPEKAKGRMIMITYPVTDLVVPVENYSRPGVSDMNTALARHLANATGATGTTASPYTPPMAMQSGTTVSSQSSGTGSTFAMNGNVGGGVAPSQVQTRAPGENLQALLINLIQNTVASNTWSNVGGQGTIQFFELGNALVINQTQEVQEDIQALLASLRRLQDLEIAIEMRLVSVSESFFERIGVDFNVNIKSPTSATNQVNLLNGQFTPFGQVNSQFQGLKATTGLTPAGQLTPDLAIPIHSSSFSYAVPPFGGYPGVPGADGGLSLGLAFLSDIQVFMFLEAAQGDRRMNIMQAPKLTVFNGQTANINVQDFQFFLTGVSANVVGAQTILTPNNQPFPLGVTMQVTPVVSADRRFVRLNLTPSLTNLANANVPLIPIQIPVPQLLEGPGNSTTILGQPVIYQMVFQQPTFTQITVNTTVNVPDGGTVLLGGLKTMSEGRNEFGPPILSKIPYLSRLFKNTSYGRDGQSLMIMVTPRIIINEEEERIFTGQDLPIPRP